MVNKHQRFTQSLRNIMRGTEAGKTNEAVKNRIDENTDFPDEEAFSLAEELAEKFDELFGPIDND
ncbi:hypothetical protein AALA00_13200 [Lachnospiraceae bacterium 46-15]